MHGLLLIPIETPTPRRDVLRALAEYYEDDDEADYDDGEEEDQTAPVERAARW